MSAGRAPPPGWAWRWRVPWAVLLPRVHGSDGAAAQLCWPDASLSHSTSSASSSSTPRRSISDFHGEVSRALGALGVPHTLEHLTDDQLFSGGRVGGGAAGGTRRRAGEQGRRATRPLVAAVLRAAAAVADGSRPSRPSRPSGLRAARGAHRPRGGRPLPLQQEHVRQPGHLGGRGRAAPAAAAARPGGPTAVGGPACVPAWRRIPCTPGLPPRAPRRLSPRRGASAPAASAAPATRPRRFKPLGEMRCRHTLLRVRGWRVVSVPFFRWSGESGERARPGAARGVQRRAALGHRRPSAEARMAGMRAPKRNGVTPPGPCSPPASRPRRRGPPSLPGTPAGRGARAAGARGAARARRPGAAPAAPPGGLPSPLCRVAAAALRGCGRRRGCGRGGGGGGRPAAAGGVAAGGGAAGRARPRACRGPGAGRHCRGAAAAGGAGGAAVPPGAGVARWIAARAAGGGGGDRVSHCCRRAGAWVAWAVLPCFPWSVQAALHMPVCSVANSQRVISTRCPAEACGRHAHRGHAGRATRGRAARRAHPGTRRCARPRGRPSAAIGQG